MLVPLLLTLTLAQSQDLTLSIGASAGSDFDSGHYFGANYAHRIVKRNSIALSGQIDFLASPNRAANFNNPFGSRDVASLFLMPGLRVSFQPESRISPFVAGGAGLAVYEQSALLQNGNAFPGSRTSNHFGGMYGGGVDVGVYRGFGVRFEVKDYYAQRHNVAAGVGLHLRWGGK